MKARAALLAAFLGFSAPVIARSFLGMVIVDPVWLVQAASDQGSEITANEGDWVTRTSLLPGGLAELQEPAVSEADGNLVYPGNEKLVLRSIGDEPGLCTITHRKIDKAKVGLPGSSSNDICFVDSDGDGRFETSLRIKNIPGTSSFGASLPYRHKVPLRPAAYRRLEPTAMDKPLFVGVKFSGVYIDGKPHFTVYYGEEGHEVAVDRSMQLARDGKIDIFGATYSILARDKHVIKVHVDKAIPAQRFQLTDGVF